MYRVFVFVGQSKFVYALKRLNKLQVPKVRNNSFSICKCLSFFSSLKLLVLYVASLHGWDPFGRGYNLQKKAKL